MSHFYFQLLFKLCLDWINSTITSPSTSSPSVFTMVASLDVFLYTSSIDKVFRDSKTTSSRISLYTFFAKADNLASSASFFLCSSTNKALIEARMPSTISMASSFLRSNQVYLSSLMQQWTSSKPFPRKQLPFCLKKVKLVWLRRGLRSLGWKGQRRCKFKCWSFKNLNIKFLFL